MPNTPGVFVAARDRYRGHARSVYRLNEEYGSCTVVIQGYLEHVEVGGSFNNEEFWQNMMDESGMYWSDYQVVTPCICPRHEGQLVFHEVR